MTSSLAVVDRALVAHRWPTLSPWWRETFTRFDASGCRQLVVRAGRRGGKSSSVCRYAVSFALDYDLTQIPPGDVGIVAFISTSVDEASRRLRTIRAILDALGIAHRPLAEGTGVEIIGRPIAFQVFAATIAGVSGPTAILVVADEVAKWRDRETGANPASDVLASARPMMATQPRARMILISSPLTHDDAHARAFADGDTAHQITAYAPTWIANPTVTEEQTRRDEPDARVWSREYLAVPQAGALSAFDVDAVDRAFAHPRPAGQRMQPALILDPSSGKKDAFTFAIARWVQPTSGASAYLDVERIDGVGGRFWDRLLGTDIVARLVAVAREEGIVDVHADQRESLMLRAAFEDAGLAYHEHSWTSTSKPAAVERVRRWMRDGVIALPAHDGLRRELLMFEERIAPSGQFTFGARGSGHDDFVALLITTAMGEIEGSFVATPAAPLDLDTRFEGHFRCRVDEPRRNHLRCDESDDEDDDPMGRFYRCP